MKTYTLHQFNKRVRPKRAVILKRQDGVMLRVSLSRYLDMRLAGRVVGRSRLSVKKSCFRVVKRPEAGHVDYL